MLRANLSKVPFSLSVAASGWGMVCGGGAEILQVSCVRPLYMDYMSCISGIWYQESKLYIIRKCKIYDSITRRGFLSFIVSFWVLFPCVVISGRAILRLFVRYFNPIKFLLSDLDLDIGNCRVIGALSALHNIVTDNWQPFYKVLPDIY